MSIERNTDEDINISGREMYAAIDHDSNTIEETGSDGKQRLFLGAHFGSHLFGIEKMVEDIALSDNLAFEIQRDEMGRVKLKRFELGDRYFHLCNPMLSEYCPQYEYSPRVTIFFDACFEKGLWFCPFGRHPLCPSIEPGKLEAERFNDLLLTIREQARSKAVKDRIYARAYNSVRNYREAKEYIDGLFRRHSRLLVLRQDYSFRKEYAEQITIEGAQRHLRHFFNNMRANKLFSALVGQIWKMEVGAEKGVHFHVILFFHGSKVHKDAHLGSRIGAYWNERITEGQGIFYNCNQAKNDYKRCGIGMINHDDVNKRQNLLLALQYLTKEDQYLRYKPKPKCRAFGKGNMPQLRQNRAGRPRSKEETLDHCR